MGYALEGNELEKNKLEKAPQSDEEYLQECLSDYKINQGRLKSNEQHYAGFDQGEDRRNIAAFKYARESLKERIIKTAEKVGKDGLTLIAEADEEVRRSMEK